MPTLTGGAGGAILNQMVERQEVTLDGTFSALSNPTRRGLLLRLRAGEATVSELAEPFDMSLAAVSKHLRVLEAAGLVERRIRGREHRLRLRTEGMRSAASWLVEFEQFWQRSLDGLQALADRSNP